MLGPQNTFALSRAKEVGLNDNNLLFLDDRPDLRRSQVSKKKIDRTQIHNKVDA